MGRFHKYFGRKGGLSGGWSLKGFKRGKKLGTCESTSWWLQQGKTQNWGGGAGGGLKA